MPVCCCRIGVRAVAAVIAAVASTSAEAQVTARLVPPIRWGGSDGAIGLVGATLEDFEDVNLAPGLQIKWTSPAATIGPVAILPQTFNPATGDPFGTAFSTGAWDGTRALISAQNNQSYSYGAAQNWGDVEFTFSTPVKAVGFSLQQADAEVGLLINGVSIGGLGALTGASMNGGRIGYFVITAGGSDTISSVKLDNFGGDGFTIDHMLYTTQAPPEVNITGFPAEPWPRADTGFGLVNVNAIVEDFEDVSLAPGLSIGWDTFAGQVAPSGTLPNTFAPVAQDPFGNAFDAGVWDGTREVINTRDNASHAYTGTGEWGDIIFQFSPARQAVAFSFQQAESPVRLVINGRDVGDFLARAGLPQTAGRHGFIRIDTPCGGTPISEIRLNNTRTNVGGDGFAIDHLMFGTSIYFTTQPQNRGTCPTGVAPFSVAAGPAGPGFFYTWQIETSPGNWLSLGNNPGPLPGGGTAFATPFNSSSVSIGVRNRTGQFGIRCLITNSCASGTSEVATLTVGCNSIANIVELGGGANCDDQLTADDIIAFLAAFFAQQGPADVAGLGGSIGGDGQWTADDIIAFLSAFFAGCP